MTSPTPDTPLKIGTRGSPLALAQAHEVRARLAAAHGLAEDCFAITVIQTTGDAVQDRPLSEIGGKGLFTKEIEAALLDRRIDIAVHSTKDVANLLPDGLALTAFLPREDVRDSFISRDFASFDALPQGAVVGSSSIRRRAQMAAMRPDLNFVEFRGNVQTRLAKLDAGVAVATLLASAGLNRLGQTDLLNPIPPEVMLPAVAQGAISIEQRQDDALVSQMLAPLNHADSALVVAVERAFLAELDGSCRTPIAGLAELDGETVTLRGEILKMDGSAVHRDRWVGTRADAVEMGAEAGRELLRLAGPNFL
ncbi:hydroxymethylbilane synthase [Monaibacterium marinum]|uniref:Porphobilinogen deaminase n=1 Tax=Pontivivens marinum TaxID=1690039 RepID=A0A2C9CUB2_9RHOB|nr:hydroxymethylbilane synthase [Monaibacterium marinum]SOH94790.1 hydroxymethylbilane synthase [Monaibacterium marinum]